MNTLKYQKSTLKILDFMLREADKEFIVEELLSRTRVGRNLGFSSLKRLESDSILIINQEGKQRRVAFFPTKNNLSMRFFFDAFFLQSLPKRVKFTLSLFISQLTLPISVVLFGSTLSGKEGEDIDLLILYHQETEKEMLLAVKKQLINIAPCSLNLHFTLQPEVEFLLKGICLYGREAYLEALEKKLAENRLRIKDKLLQCAHWCYRLKESINNPDFADWLEKTFRELSFLHAFIEKHFEASKEEAKVAFNRAYKKDLLAISHSKDQLRKFQGVIKIFYCLGEKVV